MIIIIIIIIIIIANFYTRFSHEAQSAYSVLLPRSLDTFQCRTLYTVHNFHSPGSIPCLVYRAAKLYLSFLVFSYPKNQYFAEEISIFPRGNNMTKKM